jgi:putative ABC transport system substrate-binding protein
MKRRDFITLLGGATAWPIAAPAQERMRRIGALMPFAATDSEAQERVLAFEQGLREFGWLEGRTVHIDYRWVPDDPAALRSEAAALIASAPDLILANGTPALKALQEQTRTLPIVFVQVADPIGQGFVSNLAHPGANITGFTTFEYSIGSKWLQTLKEVVPAVNRIAVMFNPVTAPYAGLFWEPIKVAGISLSIEPIEIPVHNVGEIERAITGFAREPNGALLVIPDTSNTNHRDLIVSLANRYRLPAIYPFRFFATSGGLMSYGSDVADLHRRAASYVDRNLCRENPGDLPVQQPTKYEFVINLMTAKALNLTIPATLLALANDVIE